MKNQLFFPGSRVRVISYGPFRGLEGTILRVDAIADDLEEQFCFSLIALEGTSVRDPIWFEDQEVEPIGCPPLIEFQAPRRSREREFMRM